MKDKATLQEEKKREFEAILNATTKGGRQEENTKIPLKLTTANQVAIFKLVQSLNQGNSGNAPMRPEIAMKQLEEMEKLGINIDTIIHYL